MKAELRLWLAVALQQLTGWKESTCYTLAGLQSRWHWIQAERRVMKQNLRTLWYPIIRRDGRCLRCGSMAELQVDHVVSLFHFGKSEWDNLQTLCGKCNRWKGIRDIDYRNHELCLRW